MGITPKQKQVAEFITQYVFKNHYGPSQAEIAQAFGFKSLGTVQNYLVRLEREGVLTKTRNAHRGARIVSEEHSSSPPRSSDEGQAVPLPIAGRVAAGRPIEAIDQEKTLDVPLSLLSGEKHGRHHFVLKVVGDSMRDDGILDGDFVVIRKQSTAENGQTVVALLNSNEATIKRYYKKQNGIELHPANPNYQPILISSLVETPEFKIEGVLTGLIRKLI